MIRQPEIPARTSAVRAQAAALVAEADRLAQPVQRAAKLLEAGDLYRESGQAGQASEYYFQAVAVHPEQPTAALSRLAQLARESADVAVMANLVAGLSHAGHWRDVVLVLTRQADAVHDTDERAGLLLEASRICTHRLNDFGLARTHLLAAARAAGQGARPAVLDRLEDHLRRNPADDAVGVAFARLLTTEGEPGRAVKVLVRSARNALEKQRKAALFLDAAILCADKTKEPLDALVHLYEALTLDPDLQGQVNARLDAIQARWLHLAQVGDALEGIYTRLRQPEKVQAVIEARLAMAAPEERPALIRRLAEHIEYQLIEPERAFQLYRQGLEEGRGELEAFAQGLRRVAAEGVAGATEIMAALFSRLGRWRDLVEVLDTEAALQSGEAEQAALLFRGGEILQTHLDDLEGAMQRYVRAFQLQPRNPRYLAAGERLYRRRKDWRMVDRLLGLQVQIASEVDQRQRLLVEQARVRHRKLAEPVGAYDVVRQALELGVLDPALNALRELVQDDRSFPAIERALRDRVTEALAPEGERSLGPPDASPLMGGPARREGRSEPRTPRTERVTGAPAEAERPAELPRAARHLKAAELLQELAALELEMRNAPSAALSALAEASRLLPSDVELFQQVAELMADHADRATHARWLAEAASRRGLPTEQRLGVLGAAARLFEAEGLTNQARDARKAALVLAPRDSALFEAALASARAAGEPGPLARLLDDALEGGVGPSQPDKAQRQAWRRELAAARAALGDTTAAAECWQAVMAESPLDADAMDWLAAWYEQQGAWESLRGLLDTVVEARMERDGSAPQGLLEELARLAEGPLADPRLAVVYGRRLFDADPESEEARSRLHRLFAALGDREGQIGLLELELVTAPAGDREVLARRLVEVASAPPVVHPARRRGLEALLALAPDDLLRLDRLAEALREEGSVEARRSLAGVLARRWAVAPGAGQVWVLRELALVLAGLGAPTPDVVRAWSAVLDVAPEDDDALAGLQTAHARAGDDGAVLSILWRRRAALPASAENERRRFLREAALVAEVRLGDLARAVTTWELALTEKPGDFEALEELVRLVEALGDMPALVRHGRVRLEQVQGEDRLILARRLARAVETTPAAAERLNLDAVDEATRLWGIVHHAEPIAIDALEGLARAAEARGDRAGLLSALDRLVPLLAGAPLRQVQTRRATVLTELGDLGAAMEAWEAVRALAPDARGPVTAIRRLALERKDWWSAARALATELRFVSDTSEALALNRQLARLSSEALGDQLGALAAWERVLDLKHDDFDALRALKTLYADLARLDDVVRVLRRLLELAPDDAIRGAELVDAARLLERLRGDPAEIFECWRRAYVLGHGDTRHQLVELRRLAEAGQFWRRYCDVLDVARKRAEGPGEEAAHAAEQARIAERHLGEPDRAFALARAAFELQPDDGPTLALLVRLAEARGAWEEVASARIQVADRGVDRRRRAELLRQAAEVTELQLKRPEAAFDLYAQALEAGSKEVEAALVRLAEARKLWPRLVDVVNARWKGKKPVGPRIEALLKLANLLEEKAHDWEKAFEQVVVALQLDPRHERAREVAWRLADEHETWPIVARVLELKANDAEEAWIKASLLRDLAWVHADRLADPGKAFGILKRAFAVRPWDDETGLALAQMAGRVGGWKELAAFYEEEAGWAEERTTRLHLYRLAVQLHQRHGEAAEAARLLERVAELEPQGADTVDALLALRRQAGDAAELAASLEAYARTAEKPRRQAMLRELADLCAGVLDAPTKAEDAWRQLLALDADDDAAFAQLTRSLRGRGAFRELDEALEKRIRQVRPGVRRALQEERIEILWHRLGRLAEAYALQAEVTESAPEDIERLFALAERADAVRGHATLLACAERSLAVARPADQPRLLRLIGRTARDHLNNPTRALDSLALALELDPEPGLAGEVAELLKGRRRFGDLVVLYKEHGPAVLAEPNEIIGDSTTARWALAIAGLQADQLYRLDEAMATVRRLLEDQPGHIDAWERLRGLALRRGDGDALAEAVVGLADSVAEPLRLSVLETGARDVARLGAVEAAVDLWRRVLARAPGRPAALDALESLAGKRRDATLRAETLARRAEGATGEEKANLLCELGALHRSRGELAAAEAVFRQALEAHPKSLEALESLADLVKSSTDEATLEDVTERLHKTWKKSRAEATRTRLAPRVADFLLARARRLAAGGDEEGELKSLEQAWSVAPRHLEVGQALADAFQARNRLVDAAHIYADVPLPAAEADPERKATEQLRRARAYRAAGEDTQAVRHFDAAAQHPSSRLEALTTLVALHEAAGRWEAAIRTHLKVAEAEPELQAAACAAAGQIAEQRLGKPGRALGYYLQALRAGLDDVERLRALLPVVREHGQPTDALRVIERLLTLETDPAARTRLVGIQADLLERTGASDAARSLRRTALAQGPLDPESARGLLEHLDEANPSEQLEILSQIREQFRNDRSAGSRALLAGLATALTARGDLEGAVEVHTTLASIDPRHRAREALADLHRRLAEAAPDAGAAHGHVEQALGHQLSVVRARPTDSGPLRGLADLYRRFAQPTWRLDALCALDLLRVSTPEEQVERSTLAEAAPVVPAVHLAGRLERILPGTVGREPAGVLLAELFASVGRDFDALFGGAPAGDPPGARLAEDDLSHAEEIIQVRAALGLSAVRVWLAPDDRPPGLWRVQPVELVMGRQWLQGSQRRRVFKLARALELCRGPALLAVYAPEDEVRALFGAALVSVLGDDGLSFAREVGAAPALIPSWSKFLSERLTSAERTVLERRVAAVVAAGPTSFHHWTDAVRLGAQRMGYVMSGDLGLAIEVLREEAPGLRARREGADDLRTLLDRAPAIADLHGYVFGDDLLALRKLCLTPSRTSGNLR